MFRAFDTTQDAIDIRHTTILLTIFLQVEMNTAGAQSG